MAKILPPNVLTYLATYVNKDDQLGCALVCKQWTEPFLNAYWARVNIYFWNSKHFIDKLYLRQDYQKNAHRTWALDIHLDENIFAYIPVLQQTYSRIKYFSCSVSEPYELTDIINWSLWKTLSHLKLDVKDGENVMDELLEELSVLPCLIHLTIKSLHSIMRKPNFSLANFESLHCYFPRLQYIKIQAKFKPISEKEIEKIRNVEPAHNVTKIDFNSPHISSLWIFYSAHKYPNIVTCYLSSYGKPYNVNPPSYYDQQKYQSQLQLLLSAKQFFPCLQKIHMEINQVNIIFDIVEPEMNDLNTWIKYFSESVEILHINYGSIVNNFIPPDRRFLVHCNKLTELSIKIGSYICIEKILDHCPVLQLLYIKDSCISYPEYPQSIHLPHPLRKLVIINTYLLTPVFNYISFRCGQLKYMELREVRYHIPENNETGQVLLDMSFSQLKVLITYGTQITKFRHRSTLPKHIVIEQMGNNSIDQGQAPQLNWHHLCVDKTNRKSRLLAWKLGRRDIEFAHRYLQDFKRRRGKETLRKDMKRSKMGYKLKRFWKRDLQYGVLIFRFKSVEEYFIDKKDEDQYDLKKMSAMYYCKTHPFNFYHESELIM
ncbi:hypothetical protein J3Q64DRAFT_1823802 [Phycomyces blakesleeanus]|uniref:F-box domain-containing protein n=2 Tax=Phycomyces blakesleeanus TaxID=4837 RepID=A0A167RE50_PHYB8|nr:hypothetical protein PHYBLDRAFT_71362 [Phycomyces blakesleeanus NRRL 1555(-)]OAD81444.1 hypothetical protein PHYBLDRAFT_71362 [Phycomyces blakesleeanus NRRL 1555(-)]|eukprot:XP_018299484.1 hypothetical protein PHYBLDRAFT_71362 [Phycomyces blakesleeanus NRRL 1555(-)]